MASPSNPSAKEHAASRGKRDGAIERAAELFAEIAERSADPPGVTRAPYGPGEQMAHDVVAAEGRSMGLEVAIDAALNLRLTLPGRERALPGLIIGSHLDSVPHGGNFDGLAGVLAGIAALARIKASNRKLRRDVSVMAIRGEENAWFSAQHVGSRAALGRLSADALDNAKRIDTGRSLAEHMAEAGADMAAVRTGRPLLDTSRVAAYLEVHIEQGPLLVRRELPVGIVTGIRGALRCRDAVCLGEYGHSGTVPRSERHDAVMAVAELAVGIDKRWEAVEREGGDLVATIGVLSTDPAAHGVTVVPGRVGFTVDVRSHSEATLRGFWDDIRRLADGIAGRRGVTFSFGPLLFDPPVAMDGGLRRKLAAAANAAGVPFMEIASGAGHDAGDFAAAGIPAAMIFVRNRNGSHNPDEAMEIDDFSAAVEVLVHTVEELADQ